MTPAAARFNALRAKRDHLLMLRTDALKHGLHDIAKMYGASAMRMTHEMVDMLTSQIMKAR